MLSPETIAQAGIGAYFRPRDLEALNISFQQLQNLVEEGAVQKVGYGLYRLSEVEPSEFETLAMVAAAVPDGIVCLLSALQFHGIGTQLPSKVWLAIDRKARKSEQLPANVRIVWYSGAMLTYAVDTHHVLGVPAQITSPARTVVDCFRYRNKVGLDVALEALRDAVRMRKATIDEIERAAEVCRARTVMRKYLEALTL